MCPKEQFSGTKTYNQLHIEQSGVCAVRLRCKDKTARCRFLAWHKMVKHTEDNVWRWEINKQTENSSPKQNSHPLALAAKQTRQADQHR